ncbi:hypothetical protein B6U99_00620 [Candidatus Geothermarchaeota archaeon ex4572_27]|nr:MAG: hypothetical protein B6U99_00620 [Candidatus Geothermarchaeota archaeon ex4572_27]
MTAKLVKSVSNIDPDAAIDRIVREMRAIYSEVGADGILVNVKNTLSSFINLVIAIRVAGRSKCYGIYFEKPHENFKNIERMYVLSRFNLSRIDIKHIYRYVARNMPDLGLPKQALKSIQKGIEEGVEMLFLRLYASENNYILSGDIEKTRWLTGAFSRHLLGSFDVLPLASIFKTQLRPIARRLRIIHLAKNADEPSEWVEFKRRLGIEDVPDEKIDAILYGLESNWSTEEIASDLEIDENIVVKLKEVVQSATVLKKLPLML